MTKGAMGNLINRYRAVLAKCRLLNTFGSLAVAAMLVMGAAGSASAVDWSGKDAVSVGGGAAVTVDDVFSNADLPSLSISGGSLTLNAGGRIVSHSGYEGNGGKMAFTMSGGELNIISNGSDLTSIDAQTATISGGTVTIDGGAGQAQKNLAYLGASNGLYIKGGTINLENGGRIYGAGTVGTQITGGTINMGEKSEIWFGLNGAAQNIISGGTINVTGDSALIELARGVTMSDGEVNIKGGSLILTSGTKADSGYDTPSDSPATLTQNGGTIRLDGGDLILGKTGQEPSTVAVGNGGTVQAIRGQIKDGGSTGGSTMEFKPGSTLAVDVDNYGGGNGVFDSSITPDVDDGANLSLAGAREGVEYDLENILGSSASTAAATWVKGTSADIYLLEKTSDSSPTAVSFRKAAAEYALPGLDSQMGALLDQAYANGQIDNRGKLYAADQGSRFLSRAVNSLYTADRREAVAILESGARTALNLVPHMTWAAHEAAAAPVAQRTSLAASAGSALNGVNAGNGLGIWAMPLYSNWKGRNLEAGKGDLDVKSDMAGMAFGVDYTFLDSLRVGLSFHGGGGDGKSEGDFIRTSDDFDFWGVGAYAGWRQGGIGLSADLGYTHLSNDLHQTLPSKMDMGALTSDVSSWAFSTGLRGEYRFATSVADIIPHAGVRYTRLNTNSYNVNSDAGTVLRGDSVKQDIVTVPVGVALAKILTLDGGWTVKPSLDLGVVAAGGDVKGEGTVRFTGVDGAATLETQVLDRVSGFGQIGVDFGKETLRVGLNYRLQAGAHTTAHGLFGTLRYEF